MDYLKKVHISKANQYLPSEYVFICCASFEDRCCTLSTAMDIKCVKSAYIFRNIDGDMKKYNEVHFQNICDKFPKDICKPFDLHFDNPLDVMETLRNIVHELISKQTNHLIVDISTFTHEVLLIILKILHVNRNHFKSILLVYNGADKYEPWLSKGCKEIRNVIGYPGIFNPAQKYHLVVLTGFEWERATKLVDLLEPDILSIGTGTDPTNINHRETMATFENEFENWIINLRGVPHNKFSFSCSDIISTISCLQEIFKKSPTDNFILVPLNTKLSTISVALVALANSKVQVCYPVPEVYNMSYSVASSHISIINFLEIDAIN